MARLAALLFAACCGSALADDPPGPPQSRQCFACHGTQGLSTAPDAPSLAGQPRIYLVQQLKAFRTGKRNHEVMNVVAKPLTDDDIDALAAWYSSFEIQVRAKR